MNKRIKEIALQAKQSALDAMIKITDKEEALKVYSETYDTKFAELIVRECAKTAENSFVYWPMDGSLQRTGCARTILGHFGVEE